MILLEFGSQTLLKKVSSLSLCRFYNSFRAGLRGFNSLKKVCEDIDLNQTRNYGDVCLL